MGRDEERKQERPRRDVDIYASGLVAELDLDQLAHPPLPY